MLIRSAPGADEEEKRPGGGVRRQGASSRAPACEAVGASFLVLFAAEWGDLSQLLTISMIAKYGHPWSVFIGAWAALLTVSGLAVLVGRVLLRYVKLSVVHYVGGGGLPAARGRHRRGAAGLTSGSRFPRPVHPLQAGTAIACSDERCRAGEPCD